MASKHHSTGRNRRSRNAKLRRRSGAVSLSTAAGAFFAAAMAPMATAPAARADVLDVIIDPIINPLMAAGTAAVDSLNLGAAAADMGAFSTAALDSLNLGTAAADMGALSAAATADVGGLGSAAVVNAGPVEIFNQLFYEVLNGFYTGVHTVGEAWVTSPIGQPVDQVINAPFVFVFGRDLIGNGVNGFTGSNTSLLGSSGFFGNLGDGGFLFGDGGTGASGTIEHVNGFAGGAGGLIGNGGMGGTGYAGRPRW